MVCAVGMAQLEIATATEFTEQAIADTVRIGVPGAPVLPGLVWATGRVMKMRKESGRVVYTIGIEDRISQSYKNVVKYWSLMQRKL